MKLLIIAAFLFSVNVYGQKKLPDSSKDSSTVATSNTGQPTTIKADSVMVIMNDFLIFLQDKVTVKDYLPVQAYVQGFLKSKEFDKPKKK